MQAYFKQSLVFSAILFSFSFFVAFEAKRQVKAWKYFIV